MKIDMQAIENILADVTFFVDRNNCCLIYAEYTMPNGDRKFSNIDSKDFGAFLRVSYANETNADEPLNETQVLQQIHDESRCYNEFEKVDVYHRTAGDLYNGIDYYLANSEQQVVHIDASGFNVTTQNQRKFIDRAGMLPQVLPMKTNKSIFELLAPFVNIRGSAFKLFVIWLIQAFSCGAHFCVYLSAERGSGKSLLTHIINKLISPSPGETCSMSRNLDDLETLLYSQYLVSFDNVDRKGFNKEYSDTFCIAVTGGTVARRKKFYDTDIVYLPLRCVLVFNGIGIAPVEEDLAERSLYFTMKKLGDTELVPERQLWDSFEKSRPHILWCIFDTLSKAMQIIEHINPEKKARLADAYMEMLAIAQVLDISENELSQMIADSKENMRKASLNDPVANAVQEFMDQHQSRKLFGSSSEVFQKLRDHYSGNAGPLPISAAAFGKRLNQLDAPLKDLGYRFLLDDTRADYNTVTIIKSKS